MLKSSDSPKLPGAYVWTERRIQLCVVRIPVNHGKVHLDNIKQFACINRQKQWPEARALRYTEDKFPWTITRWDFPLRWERNHSSAVPDIPNFEWSRLSEMLWSTVSNAALPVVLLAGGCSCSTRCHFSLSAITLFLCCNSSYKMTDWQRKDCSRRCDYREFKIVHYGRLERLDAYTDGLGPWR